MSSCVNCGQPIIVTSRNPNKHFCSPHCAVAGWHARHLSSPPGEPATGAQHCPHCRQPLAVIRVLVPAAAAHIPTPEVIT